MRRIILLLSVFTLLFASACASKKQEKGDLSQKPDQQQANENVPDVLPQETSTVVNDTISIPENTSPVTGLQWSGEYKPVAVMIENSPQARPQSGLSLADVVYEVYVEGHITRFMSIFSDNAPPKVGPVRSARVYYVDLQQEWDSLYTHFGGPQSGEVNVYEKFKKVGIKKRADGLVGNPAITRDNSRQAPHNAYSDIEKIKQQYDYEPKPRPFKFNVTKEYQGDSVKEFSIPYQAKSNLVAYKYDDQQKVYNRFINDKPFMDKETDKQITVKNIIIQYAKHIDINDNDKHINVDLIGEGSADLFISGTHIKGSWEKKSLTDRTVFYDEQKNEIELQPGNTWIQIVPLDMKIDMK